MTMNEAKSSSKVTQCFPLGIKRLQANLRKKGGVIAFRQQVSTIQRSSHLFINICAV